VCVCERKKERARERERVCVCVCACACDCVFRKTEKETFNFVIFLIPHEFYKNEYINAHTHMHTHIWITVCPYSYTYSTSQSSDENGSTKMRDTIGTFLFSVTVSAVPSASPMASHIACDSSSVSFLALLPPAHVSNTVARPVCQCRLEYTAPVYLRCTQFFF